MSVLRYIHKLSLLFISIKAGRWFFPVTPVSSTNKTDHHDITDILLKVALTTITLTSTLKCMIVKVLLFVGTNFRCFYKMHWSMDSWIRGFYKIHWSMDSWIRGFKHYRQQSVGIFYYTPAPRRGRGYTVLPLSFHPSKIFFVAFFSVTVDDRNLIFGHKLHIGMPYCGKCFWTRQILLPVCRLSWFLYTLNVYAHFSSHFSQQLLMAEIWYLITSFIYIGTPYCGKCFLTRQIPTSCLPKSGGIISEH